MNKLMKNVHFVTQSKLGGDSGPGFVSGVWISLLLKLQFTHCGEGSRN